MELVNSESFDIMPSIAYGRWSWCYQIFFFTFLNDINSHVIWQRVCLAQGSANFFGYYPKIYLFTTILPPRPESEEKRTNFF
jgi:hypothetical protein